MPLALELAVGAASPQDHAERADNVRQRRHQARLDIAQAKSFDDLRQEETQAVVGRVGAEVDKRDGENPRVEQGFAYAEGTHGFTLRAFLGLPGYEPVTLLGL